MINKNALDVSSIAIDWDIKNTPRYCYYLMLDHKKKFLYYKRLGRTSKDDFAKYISTLSNLWDFARPNFDEDSRKRFDKLYYENLSTEEALKLDQDLMEWYFNAGPFKTGDSIKKYTDISDQIDAER